LFQQSTFNCGKSTRSCDVGVSTDFNNFLPTISDHDEQPPSTIITHHHPR
jgi:hypothetical protein